jgi:hypothetical protein
MESSERSAPEAPESEASADRRKFLAACGKFAIVTPPAITLLLSTSLSSTAIAHSSGRGDHGGRGGRDHDKRSSWGFNDWRYEHDHRSGGRGGRGRQDGWW